MPELKQRAGESDYHFKRRIYVETSNAHEEANFEAKYGVEVVRDKKTGGIRVKKRPRNEIDERIKHNVENHKRAKRGEKMQPMAAAMGADERKQLVKRALAEKKQAERAAQPTAPKDFKRDEFKFGEVVMAPPQLSSVPRRAQKAETVPRVSFGYDFGYNCLEACDNFRFLSRFSACSRVRSRCYCIRLSRSTRTARRRPPHRAKKQNLGPCKRNRRE